MFEFKVSGIVQGVGFLLFIYNKSLEFSLLGYVQNIGDGVKIVCNDKEKMLEILDGIPVLARIDEVEIYDYFGDESFENFMIKDSEVLDDNFSMYSPIPADLNLCDDCLKELFEKGNRREKYFFISCTNCGPRFSIVKSGPYDRNKTSLDVFDMCENCLVEYKNPSDRRYHAQTIACHDCGPKLELYCDGNKIEDVDIFLKISDLINNGEVVAIKGVGGFHLVCSVDDKSVKKLKEITGRFHKPFALMGKDIAMVKKYVAVSSIEETLLLSKERPLVLLDKLNRDNYLEISELSSLGFMLPYSPIHYLLFEYIDFPLVFTSSNLPGMPISLKREEQIVKWVLDYNREIVNSVDDSIVKVISDKILLVRRSRGFALNEFQIPSNFLSLCSDGEGVDNTDFLSVGAELKNTFCIKKNDKIIMSQHMGNILNLESFENYKKNIFQLSNFTFSNFKNVICDENTTFNSSIFARDFCEKNGLNLFKVQHHIAHGFSVAFENNLNDFFAIVCDGVGFGNDGRVWGGEVFFNDIRIGRLENQLMLGGDISSKEPLRMLVGILSKFMDVVQVENLCLKLCKNSSLNLDLGGIKIFYKQIKDEFNCIESSSCGRVLDCMSILLGFSDINYYEGRGAMLLESNSDDDFDYLKDMFFEPIIEKDSQGLFVLLTTPLFEFVVDVLLEKRPYISQGKLASFVQYYIAKGMYEIVQMYKLELMSLDEELDIINGVEKIVSDDESIVGIVDENINRVEVDNINEIEDVDIIDGIEDVDIIEGIENIDNLPVVFSGGCAYNKFMSSYLIEKKVLLNELVPSGDGGISLGQAAWFLWKKKKRK